jgi:hypothetical protein
MVYVSDPMPLQTTIAGHPTILHIFFFYSTTTMLS